MSEKGLKNTAANLVNSDPALNRRVRNDKEKIKFKVRQGKVYIETSGGRVLDTAPAGRQLRGAQNLTVKAGSSNNQSIAEKLIIPRIPPMPSEGKNKGLRIQTTETKRKPDLRDKKEKFIAPQKQPPPTAGLKATNALLNGRSKKAPLKQRFLRAFVRSKKYGQPAPMPENRPMPKIRSPRPKKPAL